MRILSISTGTQIFNDDSEDKQRTIDYGKMADQYNVLISCVGNYEIRQISENVFIYSTNSRNKKLRIFDVLKISRRLIKKNKINLIICPDPLINGLCGWILSRIYKTKLLVSVFGTSVFDPYWQSEHWYHIFLKFVGKKVMKDADAIQTDGYGNLKILAEKYGQKVFWKPIVPSDIDKYVVETKNFVDGKVRIAFVGRMAKQKNISMLAEVIKEISEKKYPVEAVFTIAGDGPERFRLDGLDSRENVKFIKNCNRHELDQLYKNNDILIMTSYYEGFPRVFMEAAANGLAFVITDVSGAANIVENNKNGFIIKQNNQTDFVAKLEKLINERKMLYDFSDYTLKHFSKKYNYNLTLEIHRNIIEYLDTVLTR